MTRRAAAVPLLGLVLLVDLVISLRSWTVPPLALLDWTGHLATAALALLAADRLGVRLPRRLGRVVLASSVLIDLDHLGLYAGVPHVAGAGGRPVTHSLVTVGVVLAVAAAARSRAGLAVAAGVLLHFVRDAATGPGLPLLWPADLVIRVPYLPYALLLAGLAALAALPQRQVVGGSSPPRRR